MDPAAFLAIAERCAPGAPLEPLAAIVQQASGFEPLVIRTETTNPISIQPDSKAEAIALTTELVIAGHRVRIGLAQIDTRDLTRLGVPLADGFEPCAHVKAAARLLAESPASLPVNSAPRGDRERKPADPPVGQGDPAHARVAGDESRARAWDIYGQGKGSSVLVYERRD